MDIVRIFILLLAAVAVWFFPGAAMAQQQGHIQLGPEQQLMLEAAGKTIKRDYQDAEALYGQVIAMNGKNMSAYIQRGIVRREMGNTAGAAADGQMAVTLANQALSLSPNNPNLYYERGMGFRLLKNYDQAARDISAGIRLSGSDSWKTDLQAVALEKKEAGQ